MPLHPDDVVRRTFRTTRLRGYDEKEVDAFLEEVVVELRLLRRRVDENQAEIDNLRHHVANRAAHHLSAEVQQLEQVRREREALAAELRDAESRIAQAQQDVAEAEANRDIRMDEIRAQFHNDLSVLEKQIHDTRIEADKAEKECGARIEHARQLAAQVRMEEERLTARLEALRSDVDGR